MNHSDENIHVPVVAAVVPPPVPVLRPRVWSVFLMYGVAMGTVFLVAGAVLMAVVIAQNGLSFHPSKVLAATMSVPGLLGSMGATMAVFAGAAALGAKLSPVPWRDRLRCRPVKVPGSVLVAGSGAVLGIGMTVIGLDGLGLIPRSDVLESLELFMTGLSGPELVLTVLVIGILPGIAEELMFRGYIQTRLSERWGARWAILWTSLMFGVMHLDLVQGGFAVATGAVLGFITERTGSIFPAMICHATNNTIATLLSAGEVDFVGDGANLLAVLAGLTVVGGALMFLQARLPVPSAQTS